MPSKNNAQKPKPLNRRVTGKKQKNNPLTKAFQRLGNKKGMFFVLMFALAGTGLLLYTRAAEVRINVACPTVPERTYSAYGTDRGTHLHAGLDIAVDHEPIYAAETGQISYSGPGVPPYGGYQQTIDLRGISGRVYRYAHLSERAVSAGAGVQAGQRIGTSGDGDGALPSHLHWEIRTDGGGTGYSGTVDPSWAYENCGGGSGPASAPPVSSGGGGVNNPGTDCHAYVLRYDPNNYYPCVRHLQIDIGFSESEANGRFDDVTRDSVANFQRSKELDPDGVVGPKTWCAIHTDLAGCVQQSPPQQPPTQPAPTVTPISFVNHDPVGYVDVRDCQRISGWSIDPNNYGASLQIHIYIDGQGTNIGNTNVYRPDVNSAYGITGNHGYDWALPAQWKDGRQHDVIVFAINTPSGNNPILGGGPIGPCGAPPVSTQTPVSSGGGGGGKISNEWNGRCLDVPGFSTNDGTGLHLWSCHGDSNQRWSFVNGALQVYGNKCLDVTAGNFSNGTHVQIYECQPGNPNQQWIRGSDRTIRPKYANKLCLDAAAWGTEDGTPVIIYGCGGQANQRWYW